MPKIAIVGTEGSGKTVFIATLAKRFSQENGLGVFMNPQGRDTVNYVERAWHSLSNSEWPTSTSPGELFELKWQMEWESGVHGEVRLVDCAGQDLRLLFANEHSSCDALPENLKKLSNYCHSADIMLLIVNLRDFMGEGDNQTQTANQWAIKAALDLRVRAGLMDQTAIVFSQGDQFEHLVTKRGGWRAVAKEFMPYFYGAHLRAGHFAIMTVAAVSDTEVVVDGEIPRRVPSRDFRSAGLDEMVHWIGNQIQSLTICEEKAKADAQRAAAIARQNKENEKALQTLINVAKWIGGAMVVIVLWVKGCGWMDKPSPPPSSLQQSAVPNVKLTFHDAFDDHSSYFHSQIVGRARVKNEGAPGNVRVTCFVTDDSGNEISEDHRDLFLNSGEESDLIEILISNVDITKPHHTYLKYSIPGSN